VRSATCRTAAAVAVALACGAWRAPLPAAGTPAEPVAPAADESSSASGGAGAPGEPPLPPPQPSPEAPAPGEPAAPWPPPPAPYWQAAPPAAPYWLAPATAAPPPVAVRKAGFFHRGLNIDLLALGSSQALGARDTAAGIMVGHGMEIDLGPRWAVRLTLQIAAAGGAARADEDSDAGTFVGAYLAPAVVYRFRHADRQHWIPFVSAGADLGTYSFGRGLLGLPAAPAGHGQDFVRSGPAPSVGGGILFSPTRIIGLRFAIDYAYFYVAHTSLHLLSETIALRVSF